MQTENIQAASPQLSAKRVFWKKYRFIALLFFLIGGLTVVVFNFLFRQNTKTLPPQSDNKAPQTYISPVQKILLGEFKPQTEITAKPKIVSVNKDNDIECYDPDTNQSSALLIKAKCCGGGLYMGAFEPMLSPTHRQIAYINTEDGNVWITDTNGDNKVKISNQGLFENESTWGTTIYLAGWSSNERWLVYNVQIVNEGMGINPQDKLDPSVAKGFYAADLQEGKVYFLPGLPNFVNFLPQTDLIVFIKEYFVKDQNGSTELYTYDITSIGTKKLSQIGGHAGQFTFSDDKKSIAYTFSGIEMSSAKIVLSPLDNSSERILASGNFSEVQFPKFSPDSKLIAYEKYTPATCPSGGGCPQASLVIYDLETNQEKNLGPIKRLLYWFNNRYLVVIGGPYSGPWSLQVIDRLTGSAKIINQGERLRSF